MSAEGPASLSRRQLLAGAVGLAAFTTANGFIWSRAFADASPSAQPFALSTFSPLVGSWFAVRTTGTGVDRVQLVEAAARLPRAQNSRPMAGESFSLLFGGIPATAKLSGIVTLSHAAIGSFPMFLAPVGKRTTDRRVEAVVNRSRYAS